MGVFTHMRQVALPNFTMVEPKFEGDEVFDVSHLFQEMYPDTQGTFRVTAVYGPNQNQGEMVCVVPCAAIDKDDGQDMPSIDKKSFGDAETLRKVVKDTVSLLG